MPIIKNPLSGMLGRSAYRTDPASPPPGTQAPPRSSAVGSSIRYERGGTILVFLSGSEGDAFRDISLDLVRPFRKRCREVRVVDLRSADMADSIAAVEKDGIWFVLSFFGVGQNIDFQKGDATVNLWAAAGVPFVRVFGDIPAYLPDAHFQNYPNSINFYGHPEHDQFFRRRFAANGLSLAMRPLLFDALAERPADQRKKIAGKTIVFPKNGNSPDQLLGYWRASLPPSIAKALESLGEELTGAGMIDKTVALDEELIRQFAANGLDIGEQKRLLFFMTAQLDDYLRRVKSTLIVTSLLDLPVVIRGINWGHIDFAGKRARHDPDSDYARTRQILDDALAMIDMSPNVQNFHDRVLRAAGRYTAFLSNSQSSFSAHFENHQSFTFDFNSASIRQCIEQALANPDATVEMGLKQGERMRELVGDDRYADSLLNAIDACALANGGRPPGTQDFVAFPPRRF